MFSLYRMQRRGMNRQAKKFDISYNIITSLKGIEYFTALTSLNYRYNQLTTLDLSKNTALKVLNCSKNQLTTLDVSKNSLTEAPVQYPLECNMPSLKTLYLKTGWSIKGINVDRSEEYVNAATAIEYKD